MAVNWSRIERAVVYLSFIAFLLLEALRARFPGLSDVIPEHAESVVVAVCLVAAFHYLARTVQEHTAELRKISDSLDSRVQPANAFEVQPSFPDGFRSWLGEFDRIDELLIVAYTSELFRRSLDLQGRPIQRLRLLLFWTEPPNTSESTLSDEGEPTIDEVLGKWASVQQQRGIGQIEIRHINTTATFYGALCNRKSLLVGALWPRPSGALKPSSTLIVRPNASVGSEILDGFLRWFEATWVIGTPLSCPCPPAVSKQTAS